MATSIELENVGRERYMVKDVKAKIQVDRISKELKALEVDDKDFVNRNVESKFIKDDESKEDKIDQFVVKHRETITVVQGLANTKLTNPDKWIIKIKKELSETTLFKGKEIIDKISQHQEKLERNSLSPIVKAAIANADQEEKNNCFELSSDDDYKIELELERESSKINKQRSSIFAKEDPEAGAEAAMANSIELENVGRERYMVKDVKAKIQADRISKELKALEVDDKDSLSPIVKATSDDDYKIELELERESSKINKQRSSIYAKEDPEAGAEAGKQRVREVFHTDVAELIIERDAWPEFI